MQGEVTAEHFPYLMDYHVAFQSVIALIENLRTSGFNTDILLFICDS